jgi:hypothetical protein
VRSSSDFSAPEPWYYGHLVLYAWVLGGLGLLVVGSFILWQMYGLYYLSKPEGFPPTVLVLGVLFILAEAGLAVIGVLAAVAFILLVVDIGRNIRETRNSLNER